MKEPKNMKLKRRPWEQLQNKNLMKSKGPKHEKHENFWYVVKHKKIWKTLLYLRV